ncbi:divergent polysaccharide deacetylase family protein [bacterium]|nr:divergent polysaccharide deacetylase family protein [bacterium]
MAKKKESNTFAVIISWIVVLTLLVSAIILGLSYYRPEHPLIKRVVSLFKKEEPPKEPAKPPKDTGRIPEEIIKRPPIIPPTKARIAIIIDDFGQNFGEREKALLRLGYPLTFSILPKLPYSERIAKEAHSKGLDVMLHLPMEPHGYPGPGKNPGKGAIFTNMSSLEIVRGLKESISSIPYLSGINNHMGSKATEDERVMSVILDEAEKNNLFFVDSATSQNSVAHYLAVKKGLRTGERQVFLDNEDDKEYIKGQLRLLAKEAEKDGYAIAIGHVQRKWTSVALAEMLPLMKKEGIKVVPVSEVVD